MSVRARVNAVLDAQPEKMEIRKAVVRAALDGDDDALERVLDDLRPEVASHKPQTPLVAAAQAGIEKRLRWPSMHWGVEGVHPDAWPHIAHAALEGAAAHIRTTLKGTTP